MYPEKTLIQKDLCTPAFVAALFTIARTQKQADRGMQKGAAHIHNGISHRKEQSNAICSNMRGPRDSHAELSQHRQTSSASDHACVGSEEKAQADSATEREWSHRCRRQAHGYAEG